MSPVRAVIFDLDGTLVDSLADIGGAMNEVLADRELPTHPLSAYLRFIGEGAKVLVEKALPEDRRALTPEVLGEYRRAYAARATRSTVLYPGIGEMLDALVTRGLALAVLSNKPHLPTQEVAAHLLSRWPFDPVFGEREGVARKPDPTSAKEIAARLERSPSECLFVGDTPVDLHTAKGAGMPAIGVTWGFRTREELAAAGAEVLVSSAQALTEAILARA